MSEMVYINFLIFFQVKRERRRDQSQSKNHFSEDSESTGLSFFLKLLYSRCVCGVFHALSHIHILQVCLYLPFLQQPKDRAQEDWMREKRDLERKVVELQTALQAERRVRKRHKQMRVYNVLKVILMKRMNRTACVHSFLVMF